MSDENMVKIAIIGYGKMGQEIKKLALENGCDIVSIIDPSEYSAENEITAESLNGAQVCIDFTTPDVVVDNIRRLCELKRNIVVGTTGWYDRMDEVRRIVADADVGFIWSGNFSIGVNLFFRMIKDASKLMNQFENYDVLATEFHHNQKADSPSGTTKMLGDILLKNLDKKTSLVFDKLDRKIKPSEIHMSSVRGGHVPGTHSVFFDSCEDTIELTHTARNRQGFSKGALVAARFIKNKTGFFEINDLLNTMLEAEKNV